jgi:carbamate kinase
VVTQVEVDKNDPALRTRPNRSVRSSARRSATNCSAHPDWHFVEDSGRYRRVASPQPLRIVEADAIKR